MQAGGVTADAKSTRSTVDDMSVAEVRKALAFMRKEWAAHKCVRPFFPSQQLPDSEATVSNFAFRFVMGHHHKRHKNTKSTRAQKAKSVTKSVDPAC